MEDNMFSGIIERYKIRLRLVNESDAEFILKLRTNVTLNNYLSKTSSLLSDQINWIDSYKKREKRGLEYYFIALGDEGERLGTTRLYNFEKDCFETGSWLFSKEAPYGSAIKSDIIGREFGFTNLGFNSCKFEVRKANLNVLKYHSGYKPNLVREDELNNYYTIDKESFVSHSKKLIKLLI